MRPIAETNKSLENIELSLKSIDYQLTRLVNILSEQREKTDDSANTQKPIKLLTTKEASEIFGISEYELRRGFKEGIYPAIQLGLDESKIRRMRWRYDLLAQALEKKFNT